MSRFTLLRGAPDTQTGGMRSERRHAPRALIHLRFQVDGVGTAMTRDISVGGMYLFIPSDQDMAGSFEMELDLPRTGLCARARCDVVRVDRGLWRNGVALTVHDLQIRPAAGPTPRRARWL